MSDLIDRQAAIDAICEICRDNYPNTTACDICDDIEILKQLPSAQPEIIRCKDCKYVSPNKVYGCIFEPFDTWEDGERMYSDDFCSRAERREDESD